jgi:hypothetical protein
MKEKDRARIDALESNITMEKDIDVKEYANVVPIKNSAKDSPDK